MIYKNFNLRIEQALTEIQPNLIADITHQQKSGAERQDDSATQHHSAPTLPCISDDHCLLYRLRVFRLFVMRRADISYGL